MVRKTMHADALRTVGIVLAVINEQALIGHKTEVRAEGAVDLHLRLEHLPLRGEKHAAEPLDMGILGCSRG